MTNEEKKIMSGMLFSPGDPELRALKRKAHNLNQDYNRLYEDQIPQREAILHSLLGHIGEGTFLQGPITFHYGCHTFIGDRVFINFNFTVQDDALVTIGDDCSFGPNVTIVTPVHPMLPNERKAMLDKNGNPQHMCYAKPVTIGHDCWFGANVVVCPGVTVGNNVVIGAGSVVTRDIPDNTFAAGNPARVIRPITEADSMNFKPEILGDNTVIE
ncbi:MAG: sugar O-acetyltransferase [Oscillospiraceae bacterium]|nr:sugar O-acetyltransferase [Oscillospiraceae bacterium]